MSRVRAIASWGVFGIGTGGETATLPDAGEVWEGAGDYGYAGSLITPTRHDPLEADVRLGSDPYGDPDSPMNGTYALPSVTISGQLTMTADVNRFYNALSALSAFAAYCPGEDPADCAIRWGAKEDDLPNAACVILIGDGHSTVRQALGLSFAARCDSKIALYFDRKVSRSVSDSTSLAALVSDVDDIMGGLMSLDGLISSWSPEPGFPIIGKAENMSRYSAKLMINVDSVGV